MTYYSMGKPVVEWMSGLAQSLTFVVTQDCNLRCKYCYMVGKNSENKMSFHVAKKAIDYFLDNSEYFKINHFLRYINLEKNLF